ncbi:hypothetical protein [Halalkalibacter alkalisediminis]|uniref:Uncharacterized protein n=1 Tax=Halalkalibacter alkalisediminis TaxID=935616 RepID=A0ABV6NBV1_9BACI|nr:hypothetical protein [Halalkalibacter alkalisediminis]
MKEILNKIKTFSYQFFNLLFILEYEDLHKESKMKKKTSNSQSALNKS